MPKEKTTVEERGKTSSMEDIAATLLKPQSTPVEQEDDQEEVTTGGELEDQDSELDGEGGDNELEGDDHLEDETGEAQEDEQSDDQDADDDGSDYFDINDDDLLTVMVDGEEREVSIGDLKKAHSLGGATEKRLQEATEARKAAHAERTQQLEKLATYERELTEALSNLDESVFASVIPAPDENLRRSNPERYLVHKEAYEQDQQRIADAKQAVQGKLKEIQEARNERLKEYSEAAGKVILQEIPELANEKTAQPMLNKLVETAKSYGYSDAEINSALDPRMFMLVRDAMKYRDMTSKTKEKRDPTDLSSQASKRVRRLRSGSTTAKNRVRQADKQRKAVTAKAKQTGKPQDVAATLIVPRG